MCPVFSAGEQQAATRTETNLERHISGQSAAVKKDPGYSFKGKETKLEGTLQIPTRMITAVTRELVV